jgi:ABC-2 type transport system ATP-binding protein
LLQDLREQSFTERVEPFGEFLHLTTSFDFNESQIRAFLELKGHQDIEIQQIEATVEDVFLNLL